MSGAAHRLGWSLHGVRASIESASPEALAYAKAHLRASGRPADPCELKIDLDWRWGARRAGDGVAGRPAGAQRVGKDLHEKDGRLTWSRVPGFEGLTLEASRQGGGIRLAAACSYAPRDPLARVRYLRASRRARKMHRTFFKLMYYAVYYPMIWQLERTRGWGLLHASAVERDGRAVIFSGLGGVGKSTLALSLMADPSFRFVSDNLLLHDRDRIYSLPEPVRLDATASAAIRSAGFLPEPTDVPADAHPKPTWWIEPSRTVAEAKADVVILLRFTPRPLIRPLSPVETLAHLTAARDLAKEVEGYRGVSAFLSMSVADDSDAPTQPATLASFVEGTRGYLIGIGEGEPVATTLKRVLEVCA